MSAANDHVEPLLDDYLHQLLDPQEAVRVAQHCDDCHACRVARDAALHRLAGILQLELGDQGIRAYNLHPGFVTTERMIADMGDFGFDASAGAPADVVGAVAVWLVTTPEGRQLAGTWIEAQDVCRELNLVPEWQGA